MPDINLGDIGTVLSITVLSARTGQPLDLSTATTLEILLQRPDFTNMVKTATSSSPTTGVLQAVVGQGDISMAGTWHVRAHVAGPGYDYHSDLKPMTVGV